MRKSKDKIKIFIADDHQIFKAGLKLLLEDEKDIEVIGEASSGKETIEKCVKLKFDVLILDISFPDMNGLEIAQKLLKNKPELKILMLTMYQSEEYLNRLLKIGIKGYILKKTTEIELITAIRAVANGNIYIHSAIAKTLKDTEKENLSERELKVLILLAKGYTNKEIATELKLSVKTIETYRLRISRKLKLEGRSALTEYAIKRGLMN